MNKKTINSGIALFCIFTITCLQRPSAQEWTGAPGKRFGVAAGVNMSNMNFNKGYPAPPASIKSAWKTGITIGFLMHVPLVEKLSLQPGYYFTQREGADKSTGISYSTQYFSLPLLLRYQISREFVLAAGPQAELLVHATADSGGARRNITHDVEERSIGAAIGCDIYVTKTLFISARYLQGLNHIGIGQRSNVKEFKYEVVNLMVGIAF